AGAVVPDDPTPRGVRRVAHLAAHEMRRMDLRRVALADEEPVLVVLARRPVLMPAARAPPRLALQADLQVFGQADSGHRLNLRLGRVTDGRARSARPARCSERRESRGAAQAGGDATAA